MKRLLMGLLVSMGVAMLWMSTAAQDATPSPVPTTAPAAEEATPTPVVEEASDSTTAFLSLNLAAGHPLDPLIFSMNGGGSVDAATLDPECNGYIAENPSLTVNWAGGSDFAQAFFYSDHDPTLVVQLPDGSYRCNDDVNELLLDPLVQLQDPAPGRYNIWVGSYHQDQLLPGFLVISTTPGVSVGNFSLQGLVSRSALPETVIRPAGSIPVEQLSMMPRLLRSMPTTRFEHEDLVVELVAEGTVPAFELDHPGLPCAGFIRDTPADFMVEWPDESEQMRVFFEGEGDTTLVVTTPDGGVYCNDDADPGTNLNPLVEIDNPSGPYFIFVGRLQLDEPIGGQLTVTAAAEATPAVLPPLGQQE